MNIVRFLALAATVAVAAQSTAVAMPQSRSARTLDAVTLANASAQCTRIAATPQRGVTIASATLVQPSATSADPAYCDVMGFINGTIGFEIALPVPWNHRLYMLGNGGWAGEPESSFSGQRDAALQSGFEYAHTDTGNNAGVLGNPSTWNDANIVNWGYLAVHLTAIEAKFLGRLFYGAPVSYAYFGGCSTGGRQGLMEAQRYPHDFNGIIAGDPGFRGADLYVYFAWLAQAQAAGMLTSPQIKTIGARLMAKCDGLDGQVDGLIADPRRCTFDPLVDGAGLTPAQLAAYQAITGGAYNKYGRISTGFAYGSEVGHGWELAILTPTGTSPYSSIDGNFGAGFLSYLAPYPNHNPNEFPIGTLNFDAAPYQMDAIRRVVDAQNPNLGEFAGAGGKMIAYQGWADAIVQPYEIVDYTEKMWTTMGYDRARSAFRLFMLPGMGHCGDGLGGYGPDTFDALTPLVAWVERGVAPDGIVASQYASPGGERYYNATPPGPPLRSRLLCAYPYEGKYAGAPADPASAASYLCVPGLKGVPGPAVVRRYG